MGVMFLMPILGRWQLGHRFNVAFTFALLAGIGLLTAMATNEDYAALWADRGAFADVEKLLEETENDKAKIAAHFGNDAAKIAAFEARVKKLDRIRHSQSFLDAVALAKADANKRFYDEYFAVADQLTLNQLGNTSRTALFAG